MAYTALYRKFRPTTFADVVGQEHITRTLRNQIMAENFGKSNKLFKSKRWRTM